NKDYKGLQFVKRLAKVQDSSLRRAEVYAYLSRFEDAENIYLDVDRPDLAVSLNKAIGNYKRVLELLERKNVWRFGQTVLTDLFSLSLSLSPSSPSLLQTTTWPTTRRRSRVHTTTW